MNDLQNWQTKYNRQIDQKNMKVFHIDQFKCTLCSNWFCPPFNLPYRLKCTHSICTNCLQKSVQNKSNQIICPEDLQRNKISEINVNHSTKKALQRLLKQHKNFTQTNHLQCIKSLSLNFDELLDSKEIQLKNLSTLIDQIFHNQIKRLRQIYQKIKTEINRPFRVVNDWKQVVRNYLKKVKNIGPNMKGCLNQFNHYIDEGRKIKLDLNEYLKYDFKQLIDHLLLQPQTCFTHNFSIFNNIQRNTKQQRTGTLVKNGRRTNQSQNSNSDQRQILLQDVTNNFDQSSIKANRRRNQYLEQNSNKVSLFEELIQSTPKNIKNVSYNLNNHYNNNERIKKSPLNQLILSNSNNKILVSNTKKNISKNQQYDECSQQKNYNKTIKQKIKKLKNSRISNQNNQNQQRLIKKLGKSLEYSPDDCYDTLNEQKIYDNCFKNSTKQNTKNRVLFEQQNNFANKGKNTNNTGYNNYRQNQNFDTQQNDNSLHSFYQQATTIKQSIQNDSYQHQLPQLNNYPNSYSKPKPNTHQTYQQCDEQMLLDQKSNRKHFSKNKQQNQQKIYCNREKLQGEKQRSSYEIQERKKNDWRVEHLNFLKQWKLNNNQKQQEQLEIITKYGGYDCQKQKNKYIKKIQENKVRQILKQTVIGQNYIQLVGHCLTDINITLLLDHINWNYRNIQIVKFIKTSLNDNQLNQLLNYLVRSNVHTLMLSYNNLSQISLDGLLNFVQMNKKLKNIYLPKNNISLLKGNARIKINLLKQKGINLYI